ncbi:hypothetical protein BTO04_02765 [Polaribacter sp. SA4-10]|uniref:DUF805 domain-containing protein n=1 Tax=Polaribacter sp. SA4-10 TaxID=754397 RepID=UPI000B3C63C3|nr:DUF805 domain-containing protein [Polaribacter sp. SA4-10]ARV05682.1 hypothetical protein BTO04_02765 [Polaribacter sp. SA4-10]
MNWYLKVLRDLTDFTGRSRRKEYWMFTLINFVINSMLSLIMHGTIISEETSIIEVGYAIVLLVPSIAVAIRRMHDVGKSGWYALIPIYNLILACTDSEPESNKWGENPKGNGNDDEINSIGRE